MQNTQARFINLPRAANTTENMWGNWPRKDSIQHTTIDLTLTSFSTI